MNIENSNSPTPENKSKAAQFAAKARASLKARTSGIKPTRWVRFGIVAALWTGFSLWVGSWWLLLVLFLLFDIYITGYIPFTWWKKSKNKTVRTVMAWVDAIVYALILVYFVFNFIGQNYTIPSSSLEKTLLTGDYIFVDKITYGPRVPMTPVHFPLVHNTLPVFNCNSYLEWPNVKYHRLKGLRNVEAGDIVVFNFPAGDTVMTKSPNPDYYQLVEMLGYDAVNNNERVFGKKITRPVDRRENYVKRAVGLPGQRLKIIDGEIYIDGKKQAMPRDAQFAYYVVTDGNLLSDSYFDELEISPDDRILLQTEPGSAPVYRLPLTTDMYAKVSSNPHVVEVIREPAVNDQLGIFPFELSKREGWTRSDYGGDNGILIPKKGMTVKLDEDNWLLYERAIRVYENNPSAQWKDGRVYIDGRPADTYTFNMDYYFMMGDNRDNSLDSRYWGFVPEDHIVGIPRGVLISFDKDKSIFDGKIRWNRVFRDPNPDK